MSDGRYEFRIVSLTMYIQNIVKYCIKTLHIKKLSNVYKGRYNL